MFGKRMCKIWVSVCFIGLLFASRAQAYPKAGGVNGNGDGRPAGYAGRLIQFLLTPSIIAAYQAHQNSGMMIRLIDVSGDTVPEIVLSFPDSNGGLTGETVIYDLFSGAELCAIPFSRKEQFAGYRDRQGKFICVQYHNIMINGKHELFLIEEIANVNGELKKRTPFAFQSRRGDYGHEKESAYDHCFIAADLDEQQTEKAMDDLSIGKNGWTAMDSFFQYLKGLRSAELSQSRVGLIINGDGLFDYQFRAVMDAVQDAYGIEKTAVTHDAKTGMAPIAPPAESDGRYEVAAFFAHSDTIMKLRAYTGPSAFVISALDMNGDGVPEILITQYEQKPDGEQRGFTRVVDCKSEKTIWNIASSPAAPSFIRLTDPAGAFHCLIVEQRQAAAPAADLVITDLIFQHGAAVDEITYINVSHRPMAGTRACPIIIFSRASAKRMCTPLQRSSLTRRSMGKLNS